MKKKLLPFNYIIQGKSFAIDIALGLCLLLLLNSFSVKAQQVTTLAGTGNSGSSNGTGTAASFNLPYDIVEDVGENLYVADRSNNLIRKITSAGVVTTFAGSGTTGFTNGTGTSATFQDPTGIAIDASGNLYVADAGNNVIRKISTTGVVTTFAGSGIPGSTNGTGTAAQFNAPLGLAIDGSGNVYVADTYNNKIRRITPAGVVTNFAGSGTTGSTDATGTSASFNLPYKIAIDASGNLYVSDTYNRKIRKISSAGVVTTLAGSGSNGSADGTGTAASFAAPIGIDVDALGNLFVADNNNNKIRKITSAGVVTTLAGSNTGGMTDGFGTAARFSFPYGLTIGAGKNIYVAEAGTHRIRKITMYPEIKLSQGTTELISGSSSYNFGNVPQSSASTDIVFTISNEATAENTLSLSGNPIVSLSGTDASSFVLNSNGTSLAVVEGTSTTFTIRFSPSTIGTKTATVTILNTDLNEGTYTFTITGTATAPSVTEVYDSNRGQLFSISPNPAQDIVSIATVEPLELTVYNAQGVEVMRKKVQAASEQLSIAHLKSGIYIVRCQNDKSQYQDFKLIKN